MYKQNDHHKDRTNCKHIHTSELPREPRHLYKTFTLITLINVRMTYKYL